MGGPPCQGFSYAGKRMIDDPRNFLYKEFVGVVKKIKPKLFLMENVEGILTSNKGETYKSIVADFSGIGYRVHAKKMHTVYYGVPQKRKRVIIIGILNQIGVNPEECFPEEYTIDEKFFTTTKEAINDLPKILMNGGLDEMIYTKQPRLDYQKLMRGLITPNKYITLLKQKLS